MLLELELAYYNIAVQHINQNVMWTLTNDDVLVLESKDHGQMKVITDMVALLRSLLGKYPWESYESPYPPSYGLNSTITVLLGEWLWH